MHRQNCHTEQGVTLIELLIALVVLAIALALIINTIIAVNRSPSSINLVEVGRVGAAGGPVTITYRVNFNYDSARTTDVSEDVDIEEVDVGPFQNDLLDEVTVSTTAGQSTGAGTSLTLECGPSFFGTTYLIGRRGSSRLEGTHLILAEYERILAPNVRSNEVLVDCRAGTGGGTAGAGGGGTPGAGTETGD
jgi:prepilin-type N-terminal cleavage/methylation domain-containing protein